MRATRDRERKAWHAGIYGGAAGRVRFRERVVERVGVFQRSRGCRKSVCAPCDGMCVGARRRGPRGGRDGAGRTASRTHGGAAARRGEVSAAGLCDSFYETCSNKYLIAARPSLLHTPSPRGTTLGPWPSRRVPRPPRSMTAARPWAVTAA